MCFSAQADEAILLQRIVALEQRITQLEEKLAPVLEEERIKTLAQSLKERAHERALLDVERLQRHDLEIIEKLYTAAQADWKAADAQTAVDRLIKRYPRANLTGCAVLNLAQAAEGDRQLELLRQAIDSFGGSFYPNGVQVGPYARLYLAMRHIKDGRKAEAAKLFSDLRKNHIDSIDHKGKLLTTYLEGMEQ